MSARVINAPARAAPPRSPRKPRVASAPRSLAKDLADTGIHLATALAIQWWLSTYEGNWWTGAAAGAALFIGRELAQAEYRWIELFGDGRRAALPWWGAIDPRVWDRHSLNGLATPLIGVLAVAACRQISAREAAPGVHSR